MAYKYPSIDLVRTGSNITKLMKEKNIKVSDLQEAFGFEYPQAIYKWKRGECLPTLDNLIVLSSILSVMSKFIKIKNQFLKELLNVSPFWLICRILGAIFITMVVFGYSVQQ